jgi:hypothetical protein
VPVTSQTALGTFPVEIRRAQGLYTGLAVVNLGSQTNQVKIDLYPSDTGSAATATMTLNGFQQKAEFFHENLFPALRNQDFKGMAEFKAQGPVAILALLQTQTSNGVQYATLVPTDREALRRNSYMYVPELTYPNYATPVDVDSFTTDFYLVGDDEGFPWDFQYKGTSKTNRSLVPVNGSGFAILNSGSPMDDAAFDRVSLPELMGLKYTTTPIDLSDNSPNLKGKFSFAVITDLGNYAKVRLVGSKSYTATDGNIYVDLYFEVTVYR